MVEIMMTEAASAVTIVMFIFHPFIIGFTCIEITYGSWKGSTLLRLDLPRTSFDILISTSVTFESHDYHVSF